MSRNETHRMKESDMPLFRKKPVVVEAVQWFKVGDHPKVTKWEARFLHKNCPLCGSTSTEHGRILTLEGIQYVCPGDWIITGVKGECYPCQNDIFIETYEQVLD